MADTQKLTNKPLLAILAGVVFIAAFLIIKPLLTSILSSIVLAYLFFPVYKFFKKIWGFNNPHKGQALGAFSIVILIIFIFLIPVSLLFGLLFLNFKEIKQFIGYFIPAASSFFTDIIPVIRDQLNFGDINVNLSQLMTSFSVSILKTIQSLFAQVPLFLLGSFITLFIVYYLLKSSETIIITIEKWLPLNKEIKGKSLERFNYLCRGLLASQLIIAVSQALLMGIATFILGFKHILLFVLLTLVIAVIPFLGAAVVWILITVYLVIQFVNGHVPLWHPVFMFLYGTFLVSTIDNILRPIILSDVAKINPAIVLVGFIGGFMLFGIPGVFLGPIILTLTEVAFEVFREI
ncbi:MAG: AI-2E family transporter [Candidatus Margulisbacteria bacterium]|nr:AI-2E family transporter [Candidatus Margulisiibacteriota bacterium]